MRSASRLAVLSLLVAAGLVLTAWLVVERTDTPLESSLAPAFQLLGTPVKAVDSLVGRAIPVGDLDERDLGLVFKRRYDPQVRPGDPDHAYVNEVLRLAAEGAGKPFDYRAYVLESAVPNAMALPGGVILVTRGLLDVLDSEAELAAVLSHEVGHVEQGHCFDAVKFQLLAAKVGQDTLGAIADFAVRLLVAHSFSKVQEDEADEYAWARLERGPYDPRGVGDSFRSLLAWKRGQAMGATRQRADLLRDYFSSHPPLEIREAKFGERATAWWSSHSGDRRYLGRRNLAQRRSMPGGYADPGEWVTHLRPARK